MKEVTDVMKRSKTVSTTISHVYISTSEGALGKREQKNHPTDGLKVRHVSIQSTSDSFMFEASLQFIIVNFWVSAD